MRDFKPGPLAGKMYRRGEGESRRGERSKEPVVRSQKPEVRRRYEKAR
jgi:hypothetical protein